MSAVLLSETELSNLSSYLAQEKASAEIEGLEFDQEAFTRMWLLYLAASKCLPLTAAKRSRSGSRPSRAKHSAIAARSVEVLPG